MKRYLRYIYIAVASLFIFMLAAGCQGGNQQNAATTQLAGGGGQSSGTSQGAGASQSSGSGGQSGGQSGGKAIEPNQLISKEEAATLLKEPAKDAVTTEQSTLGLKIGFYAPEKSDSKSYLEIVVMQKPQGGGGQGGGGQGGGQGGGGQGGGASSSPGQSQGSGGGGSQGGGASQGEVSPAMIFEALKKSMADPNSTEVLHIGDDTFVTAPGIILHSGEYVIYVSAGAADPNAAKETTKKAAELIVSNLKRIQGSSSK